LQPADRARPDHAATEQVWMLCDTAEQRQQYDQALRGATALHTSDLGRAGALSWYVCLTSLFSVVFR